MNKDSNFLVGVVDGVLIFLVCNPNTTLWWACVVVLSNQSCNYFCLLGQPTSYNPPSMYEIIVLSLKAICANVY